MKYSILTYDFGGYDLPRKPKEINPDVSYIFVTDKDNPRDPFQKRTLKHSEGKPLFNSQYVKHHPFEFVDTDWVVVMDSSIEIQRDLTPILQFCDKNRIEALFISSPYATTFTQEMNSETWTKRRKVPAVQRKIQLNFLKGFKDDRLNIEGMFYVLKRTDLTESLFKSIISKCDELKKLGSIPRPCQVLYSAVVANEFKEDVKSGKIAFMSSWQIRGNGTMMKIYDHKSTSPLAPMKCREVVNILGENKRLLDFKEFDRDVSKHKSDVQDDDWED